MLFDPAQYNSQSTNIVSITLGEDGDTVTVVMKQYDPLTGDPSDTSSTCSKSLCQQQVDIFTNTAANIQSFLNAIT